jgi:hypothetical protein
MCFFFNIISISFLFTNEKINYIFDAGILYDITNEKIINLKMDLYQ